MTQIPEEVRFRMDELMDAIRRSEAGQHYDRCCSALLAHPEYVDQMNQFRRKNYTANTKAEGKQGFDAEIRELLEERRLIHSNPVIADYLDAEVEICILLRTVLEQIGGMIDLQLDGLEDLL